MKITTGEAAEIVHVHESSIKRWCDSGDIEFELTPGGHRRVVMNSLLDYARANSLECDLLKFEEDAELVYQALEAARRERFSPSVSMAFRDLREGFSHRFPHFLSTLSSNGVPLERVLDDVVAPVMRRVGHGWSTGSVSVGDEHRITGLVTDALYELRGESRSGGDNRPVAVVGCLEGNRHDIGANMARMVLENKGWRVVHLGADVPVHELVLQQQHSNARLVGVSMAAPQIGADGIRLMHVMAGLYRDDAPYRLVLGGEPSRQIDTSEMTGFPFESCRTFHSLHEFAAWL